MGILENLHPDIGLMGDGMANTWETVEFNDF